LHLGRELSSRRDHIIQETVESFVSEVTLNIDRFVKEIFDNGQYVKAACGEVSWEIGRLHPSTKHLDFPKPNRNGVYGKV
jgi:hypothetical protein